MPIQTMLVRTDSANRLTETSVEQGLESRYGNPFNNANAVYVGIRDGGSTQPAVVGSHS